MKEETNENINRPSEAQVNDMYKNAWLDFHADAQKAKQGVNRRYALILETYGSYKKMPYGAKEIVKRDYAANKAKWGENGEEQQKRFGANEPSPIDQQAKETAQEISADQTKQQILEEIREAQAKNRLNSLDLSR